MYFILEFLKKIKRNYGALMNKKSIYDNGVYSDNNPGFNDKESIRKSNSLINILKKSSVDLSNINSILDYGCGGGGLIAELCKSLPQVSEAKGLDLNKDAIEYALSKNRNSDVLQFRAGSLEEIDSNYDLITVVHVLEHIQDWDVFLSTIKGKASYIYISVPIEASMWMTMRKNVLLDQYRKYGHIHFFNEPYLVNYLEESGLEVLSTGYSDEFLAFNGLMSNIIKIPRVAIGLVSKRVACNVLGGYCFQVLCKVK